MDKSNRPYNRLKSSFEEGYDDAVAPTDGWDAVLKKLNKGSTQESAEKVKQSFEESVEQEMVVPPLWDAIAKKLDQTPIAGASSNKIKESFEWQYQEKVPDNLWDTVEDQLEIETVWTGVEKALNRRSKWIYWREKGMQLGIVALLILWLRGCGVGEYMPIPVDTNYAEQTSYQKNYNSSNKQEASAVATNKAATYSLSKVNSSNKDVELIPDKKQLEKESSAQIDESTFSTEKASISNTKPLVAFWENPQKTKSTISANSTSAQKTALSSTAITPIAWANANNFSTKEVASVGTRNTEEKPTVETTISTTEIKPIGESSTIALLNENKQALEANSTIQTNPKAKQENTLEAISYVTTGIDALTPSLIEYPVLLGDGNGIPTIQNKKRLHLSFELGLLGRVGTSLMLCQQTERAMDETSMVKTRIRPAGAVGVQLHGHLTKNDVIVLTAFPFSSSQQYFAGYTEQGRYYQKEIKLTYFDFLIGYQRTLFHYNDVGLVPSSVYARVDYGLSYLSESEEVINGELIETTQEYNKLTQNVGLSLGSSHRIRHFSIDYGVSFQAGITSLSNQDYSADPTNLMTVGGYIGVHYRL